MPRGVRAKANYDEQIKAIDCKLEKHAKYVTDLKERRQALLVKKQQQTMNELQTYMQEHNLGPDDVIARLHSAPASTKSKNVEV